MKTLSKIFICLFVAFSFLLSSWDAFSGELPDHKMTPGAVNPDITQANIQSTICDHEHWTTKSIRPPANYTNKLKYQQIGKYRYKDTDPKHFEEDHLLALTLGGCPKCETNLWPQPRYGTWDAAKKDQLENLANRLVCDGRLLLRRAQCEMSANWILMYKKYVSQDQSIVEIGGCGK